jgi:hypothetical protein
MNWLDAVQNPHAVRTLFAAGPPLTGGRVVAVAVRRDGSPVEVRIDLPAFPDFPPQRWHPTFNTVQLHLDLFGPYSVRFDGTLDDSAVRADVSGDPATGFRLTLAGDSYTVEVRYSFGRIAGVSGYANAVPPM